MSKRRSTLGRGLDALIPTTSPGSREVLLDNITPGRLQPRSHFDSQQLEELADSIRLHGILQPLLVAPADEHGRHRLIAGERRWQAARMAGLESVPVIEREAEPQSSMELALVENIQRQDLRPLEEATAFDRLIRDHALTQEEVATRVGRSRSSVANTLRLLTLPQQARTALEDGSITEGHARALLGVDVAAVGTLVDRVIQHGLSVRETEKLVASLRTAALPQVRRKKTQAPELRQIEDRLTHSLGTKVKVSKGKKAGKIVIEYYSDDDLAALTDRLLQSR